MGRLNTKFKVGDKVRYVADEWFKKGKELYIIDYDGAEHMPYALSSDPEGNSEALWVDEYEFELISEDSSPHNENRLLERLSNAEVEINGLQRKVKDLETVLADKTKLTTSKMKPETPNQRRADVIKRAEAFVEDLRERAENVGKNYEGNELFREYMTKLTFHVNAEKGVVTALSLDYYSCRLLGKDFSICAPGGVFNDKIGKAIAAGRLFDVDIPQEFLDAPQPTEAVVGTRVGPIHENESTSWETFDVNKIVEYYGEKELYDYDGTRVYSEQAVILDDSKAVYE